MKYLKYILLTAFAFRFGDVFAQKHIYDLFASRNNLDVAYLENVPLDSNTSINTTIIIAKDSAVWRNLKEEFRIPESPFPSNIQIRTELLRDKTNPTLNARKEVLDNYYLIVNEKRMSISIYQYETLHQYKLLIHLTTKSIINEKD